MSLCRTSTTYDRGSKIRALTVSTANGHCTFPPDIVNFVHAKRFYCKALIRPDIVNFVHANVSKKERQPSASASPIRPLLSHGDWRPNGGHVPPLSHFSLLHPISSALWCGYDNGSSRSSSRRFVSLLKAGAIPL
uniref:Uncharacterized protein n=1 Tax=Nelumbo nucifera TaxID=4432 RepID=A0A822Y6U6_NELNU|nr:TPA_asm: hypothetical protein HUJ06_031182 [Nelumbo nucifera]